MNNYQDWAQLVAKKLEQESLLLAAIDKDELDDAAATEAFVRAVLKPFLPENYGIGSGRVVDAYGNYSDYLDIIVFNHNYPRIGMRGTHSAYLYESVLAAFAIRAKLVRKSFAEALNACASLADLQTNVDKKALLRLARKNGLKAGPDNTFVHQDPLRTARFELIGRPLSFVFGFSGFKFSYRQLEENIELWIDNRKTGGISTPMKCLPAVIATQGCFAWRNAAPLALSNREMLGIGTDDAPVRLIVLQLLYLLNRRLQVAIDGYGVKPSLDRYLSHFSVPKFETGVGNVAEVIRLSADKGGSGPAQAPAAKTASKSKPAPPVAKSSPETEKKPAAQAKPGAAAMPVAESKPITASKPAVAANPAETKPQASAKPAAESKPAASTKPAADPKAATEPGPAEIKPAAPAASRPAAEPVAKPESKPATPAQKSAPFDSSGVFDKPSPFASKPQPETPAREAQASAAPRGSIPSAPLGSAPIPPSAPVSGDKPATTAKTASRELPPLDITLNGDAFAETTGKSDDSLANTVITSPGEGDSKSDLSDKTLTSTLITSPGEDDSKPAEAESKTASDGDDWSNDEMQSTMVITPDASLSAGEKARKSGDEFIAEVKKQISSPEPIGED